MAFACAAGGPTRTAPEGLIPLDSRLSPAGGTGAGYVPASAAALVAFAYAAGGPARTAPEGLIPLDSRPSPAGGTRSWVLVLMFLF